MSNVIYPAVVTINDLVQATTLSTTALVEATQTTNGQIESVKISIAQIGTTIGSTFGSLPAGGGTGQILNKLSSADYSIGWSNIASALVASTGISLAGSTTVTVALATTAPLSLLGVAGTATAVPLPIAGTADQVMRVNAAGTAVGFGALNLTAAALTGVLQVPFGGTGTTALTAFRVAYGNGSSALGVAGVGTTSWVLTGQGTAAAPIFAQVNLTQSVTGVLTVAFGGLGTSSVATFGIPYGNGATSVGVTAAGTTAWALLGNGTSVAPSFQQVNLTLSVTGTLTVPFGGIGTNTLATFGLLYGNVTAAIGAIAATTAGLVLMSQGTLAAAAWTAIGTGTVTQITVGWGLVTGTITTTGAITIATTNPPYGFDTAVNLAITASTSGSALTLAVKGNNGSDPSATNPVLFPFRDPTIASGAPVWRSATAALSITVTQTATLQAATSSPLRAWITAHDTGTTPTLGVINCVVGIPSPTAIAPLSASLVTTVAIGSTAVTAGTFYSGVAVNNRPFLILGYFEYANITAVGQWNGTPTEIRLFGPGIKKPGDTVQCVLTNTLGSVAITTANFTSTTSSAVITLTSPANIVKAAAVGSMSSNGFANNHAATIFRNTQYLGPAILIGNATSNTMPVSMLLWDMPGTTGATTYIVKIASGGADSINYPFNVTVGGQTTGATLMLTELMG